MTQTRLATHKTMGLTVPVTECLNPRLWRERYAWGIQLGSNGTSLEAALSKALAFDKEKRCKRSVAEIAALVVESQETINDLMGIIPDHVIRWHLRAALSELEVKLGVPFGIVRCLASPLDPDARPTRDYDRIVGPLPYSHREAQQWLRIDLPSSVISVERIRAFYWGTPIWEWSDANNGTKDQIVLEWGKQGVTHIVPRLFQQVFVAADGGQNYGWTLGLGASLAPIPDFWRVDYTLGPVAQYGGPGQIEAVLADWVAVVAAQKILSMAGTAITGGVASTSLSFDGFSKSVSTTASAIYGTYSALENIYKEAEKRLDWSSMRQYKRGLKIFMLGAT